MTQRLKTWQTAGVSGYGAKKLGQGDAAFQVNAVLYTTSNAAAQTWLALIQAARGTIVTITNDAGVAFANCLIQQVGPPIVKAAVSSATAVRAQIQLSGVRTA